MKLQRLNVETIMDDHSIPVEVRAFIAWLMKRDPVDAYNIAELLAAIQQQRWEDLKDTLSSHCAF